MAEGEGPSPAARRAHPPDAGEEELAPGACVGEYVIRDLLARGGHGSVYSAEHRVLRRRAAVKILHRRFATSGEMLARFVREARVVNQIHHPAIVDIYDLGTLPDGRPYCVMELLEGQNLWHLLRQRGRFTPEEALALLEPVCQALQAAHRAGVVHRDVKASNVLVSQGRAKLLDFGIAKITDPAEAGLTAAGERLGSTHAMAPEQIQGGAVDARTDVYALGVLLFHLLTGRLPFHSDDVVELERLQLEAPPPRPSFLAPVSPAVDAVVMRCLEKSPERRFPSAEAVAAALRLAVAGGREGGSVEEREALAVHVAARLEGDDSEAALRALAEAVEAAAEELAAAGLAVPLQTGDSLLAVQSLPADAGVARAVRSRILSLARGLPDRVRSAAPHPALRVSVSLHRGEARVRAGERGPEIVGGPLFRTADWVAAADGFHATPGALEGLTP